MIRDLIYSLKLLEQNLIGVVGVDQVNLTWLSQHRLHCCHQSHPIYVKTINILDMVCAIKIKINCWLKTCAARTLLKIWKGVCEQHISIYTHILFVCVRLFINTRDTGQNKHFLTVELELEWATRTTNNLLRSPLTPHYNDIRKLT
jgi:hypothetical protein